MHDVTPRFGGIGRLYGQAAAKRLNEARVAIVGIGGVGSWAAEALARSGIGHLTLIDLDDLCVTNTNRQIHATSENFGRPKVTVMAERLRSINPAADIKEISEFFSERNADRLLEQPYDAIVDAIDVVPPKVLLLASCRARKIPVVTCGGAGGKRNPFQIQQDDLARTHGDRLLNQVRRLLRTEHGFPSIGSKPRAKKFHIPAVFSPEIPVFPQCDGEVSRERPKDLPGGLRCDAGYGTATHLTGSFGFFAASLIIEQIIAAAEKDQ
jgi:tRNA A37 threonylcarbamoyladenosine dehydratase